MADRAPDPRRCPLCGGDNACAMAAPGAQDGCAACWCRDVRIDEEVLRRVPEALRGRACICRACATGAQAPAPPRAGLTAMALPCPSREPAVGASRQRKAAAAGAPIRE